MYILFNVILCMVAKQSYCNKHKVPEPPMIDEQDHEQCLREFFPKYCVEKNEAVLQAVAKCGEQFIPKEVRTIEEQCITEIRDKEGLKGKPTLVDYQNLECNSKISKKYHKCLGKKLTETKWKELEKIYPGTQLDDKAHALEKCDCDVYKIKHN